LGFRTVECFSDDTAALVPHAYDAAGRRIRAHDVTAVNPEMAAPNSVDTALSNDDLSVFHLLPDAHF
jgi:hypothetical protein